MSIDPTDGCTFWYTQEYYLVTGGNWETRIASFTFPDCSSRSTTATRHDAPPRQFSTREPPSPARGDGGSSAVREVMSTG